MAGRRTDDRRQEERATAARTSPISGAFRRAVRSSRAHDDREPAPIPTPAPARTSLTEHLGGTSSARAARPRRRTPTPLSAWKTVTSADREAAPAMRSAMRESSRAAEAASRATRSRPRRSPQRYGHSRSAAPDDGADDLRRRQQRGRGGRRAPRAPGRIEMTAIRHCLDGR